MDYPNISPQNYLDSSRKAITRLMIDKTHQNGQGTLWRRRRRRRRRRRSGLSSSYNHSLVKYSGLIIDYSLNLTKGNSLPCTLSTLKVLSIYSCSYRNPFRIRRIFCKFIFEASPFVKGNKEVLTFCEPAKKEIIQKLGIIRIRTILKRPSTGEWNWLMENVKNAEKIFRCLTLREPLLI